MKVLCIIMYKILTWIINIEACLQKNMLAIDSYLPYIPAFFDVIK